jgi:glucokinase
MNYKPKEFYENDKRVVLTLDAGGTNLVFGAMQGAKDILEPFSLPCFPDDLPVLLKSIEEGFSELISRVDREVAAISFAFPGPANYKLGIIGDLPNFKAFRGGVALGPFLEQKFKLPVYINNDANLFVLGEFIFGFLPRVNQLLAERGSDKTYQNLTGVTLGSGFGCGLVVNGQLNVGDNSNGGELWLTRNKLLPELCVDASVGQEKIRRFYAEYSGIGRQDVPDSLGVYHIAKGEAEGDRKAALKAFHTVGEIIGDALANTSVLMDGLIVIGGGLSGAHDLLMPVIMEELNGSIYHLDGVAHPRIAQKAFYLDQDDELEIFLKGDQQTINIPFSEESLNYDALARTGVGLSQLGASRATALGAYVYALSR